MSTPLATGSRTRRNDTWPRPAWPDSERAAPGWEPTAPPRSQHASGVRQRPQRTSRRALCRHCGEVICVVRGYDRPVWMHDGPHGAFPCRDKHCNMFLPTQALPALGSGFRTDRRRVARFAASAPAPPGALAARAASPTIASAGSPPYGAAPARGTGRAGASPHDTASPHDRASPDDAASARGASRAAARDVPWARARHRPPERAATGRCRPRMVRRLVRRLRPGRTRARSLDRLAAALPRPAAA